ncbi:MAG TPA: cytochrome c, partial [Thauera aminoaromatica]|nr:cytochrome c [Thauera aminoaromatica]
MKIRASTLTGLFALAGALVVLPAAASPDKAVARAASGAAASPAAIDVPALYAQHCAACHAPNRLGAMGPALLPDNLGRLR